MRLRANERCPIHGRYNCCGRQSRFCARSKGSKAAQKVDDPHHPRGYREICSRGELRRRKHVLLSKDPTCWLCGEKFDDYSEVPMVLQGLIMSLRFSMEPLYVDGGRLW
jgi:hypothetical protein